MRYVIRFSTHISSSDSFESMFEKLMAVSKMYPHASVECSPDILDRVRGLFILHNRPNPFNINGYGSICVYTEEEE